MAADLLNIVARRTAQCVALLLTLALLSSCEAIASALPPSPSPFPTLARLPSVTPAPPTPIATPTVPPPPPTATPAPLLGVVNVQAANVRTGPGLNYPVLTSVAAGEEVQLQGRSEGWYQVITADQTRGWMSAQVLTVAPETATAVPEIAP